MNKQINVPTISVIYNHNYYDGYYCMMKILREAGIESTTYNRTTNGEPCIALSFNNKEDKILASMLLIDYKEYIVNE